jgi:hypothetical protein
MTRRIIARPAISAKGLPGSRLAAIRAGMITIGRIAPGAYFAPPARVNLRHSAMLRPSALHAKHRHDPETLAPRGAQQGRVVQP